MTQSDIALRLCLIAWILQQDRLLWYGLFYILQSPRWPGSLPGSAAYPPPVDGRRYWYPLRHCAEVQKVPSYKLLLDELLGSENGALEILNTPGYGLYDVTKDWILPPVTVNADDAHPTGVFLFWKASGKRAVRAGCGRRSSYLDRLLDEAAGLISLIGRIWQESDYCYSTGMHKI